MNRVEILPSSDEEDEEAPNLSPAQVGAACTAQDLDKAAPQSDSSLRAEETRTLDGGRDLGSCGLDELWACREELATQGCDDSQLLRLCARQLDSARDRGMRLELLLDLAQRWSNPDGLRGLAAALGALQLAVEEAEHELLASVVFTLASRHGSVAGGLMRELWGAQSTRCALLLCMERGRGRQKASGALAKLCYAAVSAPFCCRRWNGR